MILIIIWFFAGAFASTIAYYSFKRDYYLRFGKNYWADHDTKQGFLMATIVIVPAGLISLVVMIAFLLIAGLEPVFYYKIKDS